MPIDTANIWAGPPNRPTGTKPPPWLTPNWLGEQQTQQQTQQQTSPFNVADITTGINPRPVYTPEMTQTAVNNAFAQNTPDLNYAMKQFERPGVSRSAGTAAAAMGTLGKQAANQMGALGQIPLGDYITNQESLLAGETGRENAGLDFYGLMNRLTGANNQLSLGNRANDIGDAGSLLSLYQYLMGG